MTLLSTAFLLFLVMDPFGNLPLFITALKNVDPSRQRRVVVRELIIALIALIGFLFGGQFILALMGISEPSLTIAGGIILFIISIKMIFPQTKHGLQEEIDGEPFIVPLAIPYVAGPSSMASVILIMSRDPKRWLEWLGAVVLAWFCTAVVLYFSTGLRKLLGERALIALERLMGMVLTTISVQMFLTGLEKFQKTL